jgi:hypothetical protein
VNEKNLKPVKSTSEARERGRKGGINSGESRRRKKFLRECLEELLERTTKDETGNVLTGAEMLAVKLFEEAASGNVRAFEVLRDTAGQKVPDKIMISEVDANVINEVERMVNDDEETSS